MATMTERRGTQAGSSPNAMVRAIGYPWRDVLRCCFCSVVLACSLIGCAGKELRYEQEMSRTYDRLADEAERVAVVDKMSVGPARGRFLLVRGGKDMCAVRFVAWHRGRNARISGLVWSEDDETYAEYEWFYQGDGTGVLAAANVQSGRGTAFFKGFLGMGHDAPPFVGPYVDCGQLRLRWVYPNQVQFTYIDWEGERTLVELAPTGWEKPSEIDLASEKLLWYGFDLQRHKRRELPIDELR